MNHQGLSQRLREIEKIRTVYFEISKEDMIKASKVLQEVSKREVSLEITLFCVSEHKTRIHSIKLKWGGIKTDFGGSEGTKRPAQPPRCLPPPFPWSRISFQLSPGPSVPAPVTSPESLSLDHWLYLLGWHRHTTLTSLLLTGPVRPLGVTILPCSVHLHCGPASHRPSAPGPPPERAACP